jgi:hypothetical protein
MWMRQRRRASTCQQGASNGEDRAEPFMMRFVHAGQIEPENPAKARPALHPADRTMSPALWLTCRGDTVTEADTLRTLSEIALGRPHAAHLHP